MAHLPPVTWNDVATKDDIRSLTDDLHAFESVIRSDTRTEIAGVRTEIADLRGEVRTEIAGVRTEIADLRGDVHTEIAELRGELIAGLAGVRGEIHKAVSDQTKWMVGFICGWSVIVLAVARLVL